MVVKATNRIQKGDSSIIIDKFQMKKIKENQ